MPQTTAPPPVHPRPAGTLSSKVFRTLIYLFSGSQLAQETGACRVQWLDRAQPSVVPELDVLVAPPEATFVKVTHAGILARPEGCIGANPGVRALTDSVLYVVLKLQRPGARIIGLEYAGAPQKNKYFWCGSFLGCDTCTACRALKRVMFAGCKKRSQRRMTLGSWQQMLPSTRQRFAKLYKHV